MRYESRLKAGKIVAEYLEDKNEDLYTRIFKSPNDYFCYAIPNGGVPVSEGFCSQLNINYDILIVRKIKIPYNTEAGFGAVTTDGTVLFNEPLLKQLNLSNTQINNSIKLTIEEIQQRIKFYSREHNLKEFYTKNIKNKIIILLDDGLASGFTMLAGIKMIKRYEPREIYIAVPTAPLRTIQRIQVEVSEIFCPNIRNTLWFAVADAYKNWYDVPETEVLEIINKSKYYIVNI
ncbi:MAG: phosphoribosyltransferase [Candidatus Hermodarchaeota archaeon]